MNYKLILNINTNIDNINELSLPELTYLIEEANSKYYYSDNPILSDEIYDLLTDRLEIIDKNHDAGHIISEKNGGMVTVDNIVPICRGCNLSMGTINMPAYMKRHQPGNPQDFMNISTLIHTD